MPIDKDKDKDKENEKAFLINDNKKGEKIEKEHLKFGRKKKILPKPESITNIRGITW